MAPLLPACRPRVKRFGFHKVRHSLTSWLMANGENPQIVRAMLRWTNFNMAQPLHARLQDRQA
jgi:integrase